MWKTVKLGDVCILNYGKALDKKDRLENAAIPVYGANGIKTYSNKLLHDKPSIIIGRKGSAGELNKVTEPFWALDVTYYVTTDESIVNLDFLFYTLVALNLPSMARGVKPGINRNDVYDKSINLPSLSEQESIVTKLDAAFAEIDRASALTTLKQEEINNFKCSILNINNKKNDFFKSALNDLEELKIGDICDLMTGGTPSRKIPEYFDNGEIKWLVSGDINQKEIFDCDGRITKEGLNNSNAKFLPENSVLIALNGQGKTRGTVAMLKTKATCNQSLVSIFPKSGVNLNTKYLYYFLEGMYNKIRRITGDSGNDRRGLNMPLIRNIKILLPPISEQENIISKLEMAINELDIADRVLGEALKNYKALKAAILAQELQSSEAA